MVASHMKDVGDYGFTAVSEEELRQNENELLAKLEADKQAVADTEVKLKAIASLLGPFFTELMKEPEKEYIYWPNRVESLKPFLEKISKHLK